MQLALTGFGYWHYGLLLGVVGVAAGLKKAIGDPYDPLDAWIAAELAAGAARFVACEVGFRRTLAIGRSHVRLIASAAALATVPIGTELAAGAGGNARGDRRAGTRRRGLPACSG